MKRILVNTDQIDQQSAALKHLAESMRSYGSAVDSVRSNLGMSIPAVFRLKQVLKAKSNDIVNEAAKLDSLAEALEYVARQYRATELALSVLAADAVHGGIISSVGQEDSEGGGSSIFDWFEKAREDIRFVLMELGIIKAEKQTRTEGVPVSKHQEVEMDRYMQQQIAAIQKEEFSKKEWKNASVEERKKMLQRFINSVAAEMGLPEVTINWDYLPAKDGYVTKGSYSDGSRSVMINEWILDNKSGDDSYTLFSTVVHEMRHYYQHEAIRNPDQFITTQETLDSWKSSIDNYKSSAGYMREGMSREEAHKAYQAQTIEVDARSFAKQS